jgi:hypothetical protein
MGENVALYTLKTLFENYRGEVSYSQTQCVPLGKHMRLVYAKIIEDIDDVILVEISKISARKWQVVNITTNDNSYNTQDEDLYLSPANFNLKVLSQQIEILQYNSLLGLHPVFVSKWEFENQPQLFSVYDENGKQLSQNELADIQSKLQKEASR